MESLLVELARYGVPFVGFNVLLQQLGLPIPAVPTMIVAGALAADGRLSGLGVFLISVAASVVADAAWFWAGRRYGYPVLRFLCRVSLSPDACVRQTEGIFEKYGFYSLIVSKFVPGFSTVAPPVAGALRMGAGQFLIAAVASAALWVGAAMGAGWIFRAQVETVLAWMAKNAALAGLVLGGLFALYIAWKVFERWRLARFVHQARITVDELRERLSGERLPMVVDVGSRLAHRSRPHIVGAVLMDLDDIARDVDTFPRDREVVFYCACPNEASAKRAAQILLTKGFREVRPLVGGLDAWMEAGHPVEHGVKVEFRREAEQTPA
jgi:membrane protein DedA with SNARE-associated domain/rhodanese-related sulfurtransferase